MSTSVQEPRVYTPDVLFTPELFLFLAEAGPLERCNT